MVSFDSMLPQHSKLDQRIFSRYLAPDEEIVDIIHSHWLALVWPLTKGLVIGVILPALAIWLIPGPWWLISIIILLLFGGIIWNWYVFYDWYSDVFILTNQNILLINWENPFNVSNARIGYEQIEAVTHEFKGIAATIFRFGILEITTANGKHTLGTVRHPQDAQERLMTIKDNFNNESSDNSDNEAADFDTLRRALNAVINHQPETEESSLPPEPPAVNDIRPPRK